ncbi:MAG TPA: GIY-YIG nuclease family protein, partial [Candidatus Absconditabacterales bacterium]|nr:GIY-YIG nuclease family protein [Candidatus Absconditabacterales bacterium]
MSEKYFPSRPELHPQIYAYRLLGVTDKEGLLKIGYTTKAQVSDRIDEQTKTARLKYEVVVQVDAIRNDGSTFMDHQIHEYLKKKGIRPVEGERFECSKRDVLGAIHAIKERTENEENRIHDFPMRPEQAEAVEKTIQYFKSYKLENNTTPHFLRNAKMRFGKTFATYQLAKNMGRKKVLILTFKPAVENARQTDLMNHKDFEGRQFTSRNSGVSIEQLNPQQPIVCFGSFQDYLGKNSAGGIKEKNTRVHETHWDAVVFDEYHYGAWREGAKELFDDTEDDSETDSIAKIAFEEGIKSAEKILPITTNHYLYLSGTPFRAIGSGEFIEEQIYNRTYSDEQKAKAEWNGDKNPYESLPQMVMMTYQMPDSIKHIAQGGEFDEFDLNLFFKAEGVKDEAKFIHEEFVQKWLDLIRGAFQETSLDDLKLGAKKPAFPFSDVRLLSLLNHTFWFLPSVSSCFAMRNLMMQRQNLFYQDYEIVVAAGTGAGQGVKALDPVLHAMGDPLKSKTITLSTGKLTTGVSVSPRSGVLMLRNLKSPETYFQTAFRVQTPWIIDNPDGKSPNKKEILKKICYVFDFAPNRALSQIADYSNK